ncbi:MAG: hypothetical protein AAF543_14645 [Pseudomonadota bacterium]
MVSLTNIFLLLALFLAGCSSPSGRAEWPDQQDAPVILERQQPSVLPPPGVIASRLFAGPGQYPPEAFAAYGIVAFRSSALTEDQERNLAICEGYRSTLLPSSTVTEELDIPTSRQMVTVWPIATDAVAAGLESGEIDDVCATAIDQYGFTSASVALRDPAFQRHVNGGDGPFLLAWAPTDQIGQRGALVLVLDLSYVRTPSQARRMFILWAREIEGDSSLWDNSGWNVSRLRAKLSLLADFYGSRALSLFPGSS